MSFDLEFPRFEYPSIEDMAARTAPKTPTQPGFLGTDPKHEAQPASSEITSNLQTSKLATESEETLALALDPKPRVENDNPIYKTSEKRRICTFNGCNKEFSRYSDLRRHELQHQEPKHSCHECDRKFHRRDKLVSHIRARHGV